MGQKRPIVISSDEDNCATPSQCLSETVNCSSCQFKCQHINSDTFSSQPLPKRARPRTRTSLLKSRASTSTQSTLPETAGLSSRKKSKAHKKEKVGSLHTYFSATDIKRSQNVSREVPISDADIDLREEDEDVIEDDGELKHPGYSSLRSTTRLVLDRRKQHVVSRPRVPVPANYEKLQNSGHSFVTPENILSEDVSPLTAENSKDSDSRPWVEKYGPTSLEELMVHKKKVADVRTWMERFWQDGNHKKLLLLKGPAGAGKTATVMKLANALDIEVVEWRNPKDSHYSSEGYLSISAQFEDFLRRSGKFGSLEFGGEAPDKELKSTVVGTQSDDTKKRIILLEEFPNIFTGTSAGAISFRTSLLQYLAVTPPASAHSKHHGTHTPIVLIITESHLNMCSSTDEIFSAHRLLGPDVLGHPNVSVIEFNTMASTYVVKALELVVKKEARHSGRRRTPGLPLLRKLSETGDVRSAISALEFLCLRNNNEDEWSGRVASKPTSTKTATGLTKLERDSMERITRREASLGIFHAVGKVVYNKREDVSNTPALQPPQPPDHLTQHSRLRISSVSPDELIDSTGTDRQTFVATLHENYVSSCEGSSFVDCLNGCLDALSDTDILCSGRSGRGGPSGLDGQGRGASDSLRQDEIGFHLAVRGILFALPYPVKRCTSISGASGRSGGKGDVFRMFYPTSLRLWKPIEEIESLVDRWAAQYEAGDFRPRRLPNTSPSESTAVNRLGVGDKTPGAASKDDGNSLPSGADLLYSHKSTSRVELILETLPYVAMIQRSNATFSTFGGLEKITVFRGFDKKLDDEVLDGNDEVWPDLDHNANNLAAHGGTSMNPRTSNNKPQGSTAVPALNNDAPMEKFWLSDDDIEDG